MTNYTEQQNENISNIERQLRHFDVSASVENVEVGPVITRYELSLAPGVRVSKVQGLEADLAMALRAESIRLLAPVPGTSLVGIEIPNDIRQTVPFADIIGPMKDSDGELDAIIGQDTTGKPVILDIAKTPHLLVAGQTGSGKSVMINTMISSLLMSKTPEELQMIMVDPKVVELIQYKNVPHLLHDIITEAPEALKALEWAVEEMERRYRVLAEAGARNIKGYNKTASTIMPYIMFVIDEMADLMLSAGKDAEAFIQRITQKARAVGIHMVLATQRPSVDVVTGTIKANVPARIAFQVASHTDSMTILGAKGAEQLLGRGDMLIQANGDGPVRVHGAFLDDDDMDELISSVSGAESAKISFETADTSPVDAPVSTVIATERTIPAATGPKTHTFGKNVMEILSDYEFISVSMLRNILAIDHSRATRLLGKLIEAKLVSDRNGTYKEVNFKG